MAELSPWEEAAKEKVSPKELMPWEEAAQAAPTVGTAEDVSKVIAPSLLRGALGVVTAPGTVADLTDKGAEWALKKAAPEAMAALEEKRKKAAVQEPGVLDKVKDVTGAWRNLFPAYDPTVKKVEELAGTPLYEAKTPIGKGVQAGAEVLPSVLGGGAVPAIAKSVGAGTLSGLLGEGAKAFADRLPTWAEPVARAVGAVGGTFTPAGVRKVVTPLPMSDEQHSLVQALKKTDPDFVKTATTGQLTESPRMMGLESRAVPDQVAKQGKAFTEATMARGEDTGKKIGNIYDTNSINSTEFPVLNQAVAQEKRRLAGITGTDKANEVLGDIQKEIRLGASNSPNTLSMTGKRYQYLRDQLQGMIEAEGNNTTKKALTNTKTALDSAFDRSIPNAAELADLRRQKQTFEALANRTPNIKGEVDPESVLRAAAHAEGNRSVNLGKSPLANWATNASKIMTPHPAVTDKTPAWFDLLTSAAGGTVGSAEGGVLGHLLKDSLYKMLAEGGSKVAASKPVQKVLGNQLWRPGAASSIPDKDTLVRLLMSNPNSGIPAVSRSN